MGLRRPVLSIESLLTSSPSIAITPAVEISCIPNHSAGIRPYSANGNINAEEQNIWPIIIHMNRSGATAKDFIHVPMTTPMAPIIMVFRTPCNVNRVDNLPQFFERIFTGNLG